MKVGEAAPEFELRDQDGSVVRLGDFLGQRVVLFFYPKDMTPGCTQEACDFRDLASEIEAKGAVVLGVSPDSERSHQRFIAKHGLPFRLLADPENAASTAYGVWKEKSMYGRTFMGIERTTVLIDEEGRVARLWPKVKVAGHAAEVLAALG